MNIRTVISLAALANLVGCNLSLVGDGEVRWALQGTCAQYGIANWQVTVTGPDSLAPILVACSSSTSSYVSPMFSVVEGTYTATVRALDYNGNTIGIPRTSSAGTILSTPGTIYYLDAGTFTSADLTATSGDAQVHVYYAINGTIDGTDEGLSWDTCSEVGAAYLRVFVDGSANTDLTCGATAAAMNGYVTVTAGTHSFSAVLLDASKNPITTQTNTQTLSNLSASQPGQLFANFNWDSFLSPIKENTIGAYWFSYAFADGRTCAQMSGVVNGEISLLKLNGTKVTPAPKVCDSDSYSCYYADGGTTLGECRDSINEIMSSSTLKWGSYKLLLQATLNDAYRTACFSVMDDDDNKEIDILIGAGQSNPIDLLTMKKITPQASGCPQ